MKSLVILGRQPDLGLAELETLYGSETITVIGHGGVILSTPPEEISFNRLGGSIKLAKVLAIIDSVEWQDLEAFLMNTTSEHLQYLQPGKLRLGISTYGLKINPKHIYETGIRLKKLIKSTGQSVRFVPNKSSALNSAQVLHNQLTGPNGWELVFARYGDRTVLAQTVAEQDIEAYARRDQNRPMRDARVGMLPPKLAQIIINLSDPSVDSTILDPFCGTGVMLQEAMLMGYRVYGTDIDERMVEYTDKNLEWMFKIKSWRIEQADATHHTWQPFDIVACETFLGKPLSTLPSRYMLDQIRSKCDEIHEKFLNNVAPQISSRSRLCLAVPAWYVDKGFLHLKTLDRLEELGYNRLSFVHVKNEDLIYHRSNQIVARELVVLVKK
ncbi:MAG: methyltransferase domain-containing protein [bacterium]|nr:methyltransferase domain-containing protein [bacterium]